PTPHESDRMARAAPDADTPLTRGPARREAELLATEYQSPLNPSATSPNAISPCTKYGHSSPRETVKPSNMRSLVPAGTTPEDGATTPSRIVFHPEPTSNGGTSISAYPSAGIVTSSERVGPYATDEDARRTIPARKVTG